MKAVKIGLGLVVLSWSAVATGQLGKPLVQTGDVVPGSAFDFDDFDAPVINDAGAIAFSATFLPGAGVTNDNDTGVFIYRDQGATIEATFAAREGDALPGSDAIASGFHDIRLGLGQTLVMLTGSPNTGTAAVGGLWKFSGGPMGKLSMLIAFDQQVPGASPMTYWGNVQRFRFVGDGALTFWSNLQGAGSMAQDAIGQVNVESGAASLLTRTGTTPIGTGSDLVKNLFSLGAAPTGEWAFPADISPNVSAGFKALIVNNQIAYKAGDFAPATGKTFTGFELPRMNDQADVLYFGRMGADRGLFVRSGTTDRTLTVEGEPAPNSGGASFANGSLALNRALISGTGEVVVLANLSGPNVTTTSDEAIYYYPAGSQSPAGKLVVREGDPAPGLAGVTFGRLYRTPQQVPNALISIYNHGKVVFRAELAGDGIGNSNRDSLWKYDPVDGVISKILQTGDALDVCGTPRTLEGFDIRLGSGVRDGERSGVSDLGFIAVRAELSPPPGGSGTHSALFVPNIDSPALTPACSGGGNGSGGAGGAGAGGAGAGAGAGSAGKSSGGGSDGGGCSTRGGDGGGRSGALALLLAAGLWQQRRRSARA